MIRHLGGVGRESLRGEARCCCWALFNECLHRAGEVVSQVEVVAFAVLNDGEGYRCHFTSPLRAKKEPVLLAKLGGSDRVFDKVIVELDSTI